MTDGDPEAYAELGEAGWRWVLAQVQWDADGPWVPSAVDVDGGGPPVRLPSDERDGMHSGVGGLAHALAEIRLARPWTASEERLARGIADRVREGAGRSADIGFFDGLSSAVGVLVALGADGVPDVLHRMLETVGPLGWVTPFAGPRSLPAATFTDVTLGTGSAVLAGLWAARNGSDGGLEVTEVAVDILLALTQDTPDGVTWPFVPPAFDSPGSDPHAQMPNWSHGVAGICAALALAGEGLRRPDLVWVARRAAAHLVAVADTTDGGFRVARLLQGPGIVHDVARHGDYYTWNWCAGPPGTSRAFVALDRAGVRDVDDVPSLTWHDRALETTLRSGIPQRLHPGFWDNDGRCCGSAGVADILLDAWRRTGRDDWLAFAVRLGDDITSRATRVGDLGYWRFVEHRADPPLLPPAVGWMQGAAGISALLLRLARVLREGRDAPAVSRMDSWWCLPSTAPG